jgi:hypothetical protein
MASTCPTPTCGMDEQSVTFFVRAGEKLVEVVDHGQYVSPSLEDGVSVGRELL